MALKIGGQVHSRSQKSLGLLLKPLDSLNRASKDAVSFVGEEQQQRVPCAHGCFC